MSHSAAELPENSQKIRVLAADSTRMGSQLLIEALSQEPQFDVAGIEAREKPIVDTVARRKPHVLLLSSTLQGSTGVGFEITRKVHSACANTKVVLLMDATTPSAVVQAFRCGAQGVFSRSESPRALAKCIMSVHQGQVWANSAELRYLLQALREAPSIFMVGSRDEDLLSKREHQVVQGVAEGLSNREIGKRLKLTEHTVKNYLFRIFDKLGVSSRVEVVLYAFRVRGMIGESGQDGSGQQAQIANQTASKPHGPAGGKKPAAPHNEIARRVRV